MPFQRYHVRMNVWKSGMLDKLEKVHQLLSFLHQKKPGEVLTWPPGLWSRMSSSNYTHSGGRRSQSSTDSCSLSKAWQAAQPASPPPDTSSCLNLLSTKPACPLAFSSFLWLSFLFHRPGVHGATHFFFFVHVFTTTMLCAHSLVQLPTCGNWDYGHSNVLLSLATVEWFKPNLTSNVPWNLLWLSLCISPTTRGMSQYTDRNITVYISERKTMSKIDCTVKCNWLTLL